MESLAACYNCDVSLAEKMLLLAPEEVTMVMPITTEILEQIKTMPENLQYQVLTFVKSLRTGAQHGVPGKALLQFAGSIPAQDIAEMRQAIETGCEQVDMDEW